MRYKKYHYGRRFFISTILWVLFVYFAYHLFQGERGILSMLALRSQLYKGQALLAEKEAKKACLEHQAQLLRPNSLDLDMLEERARIVLHYAYQDEWVVQCH